MAGVLMPNQKKEGLLDTVMKGLAIAKDVYGIRADSAAIDQHDAQTERLKQDTADQQAGVLSQKDKLEYGKNYDFVSKDTPNASLAKFRSGAGDKGIEEVYILPKTKPTPLQTLAIPNYLNPDTGKYGTAIVDKDSGSVRGFVEQQKPPKDPHNRTIVTTDDEGNTVTKIVPDVAGSVFASPKDLAAETKRGEAQDKVYTELVNKINTPRGNQNVQQAQSSLRAIANAQELIDQYPDLNKMPAQQVALLNQELAKVASGGVGSEHGQRSLEANTMAQKWAQFQSQLGNEPTGADLGAFIEQNKQYLGGLEKVNRAVVSNYQKGIYNGYKNRLSDDQRKQFEAEYADIFQMPEKGAPGRGPEQGGAGMAIGAPSLAPTKSGYLPGTVLNIKGSHFRVAEDGDTLIPLEQK